MLLLRGWNFANRRPGVIQEAHGHYVGHAGVGAGALGSTGRSVRAALCLCPTSFLVEVPCEKDSWTEISEVEAGLVMVGW